MQQLSFGRRLVMNIEEQHTFEAVLKTGISLFLGAGFSVLAKDKQGKDLPCAQKLLEEIREKFPRIKAFNDLSKVSTVLEKSIEKDNLKNSRRLIKLRQFHFLNGCREL